MGQITSLVITDPGQYYYTENLDKENALSIYFNNDDFTDDIDYTIESTCISYVIFSTWGKGMYGGLGLVGFPGSYVVANSIGNGGVIAHELGHNFNQQHSNTYRSLSEKPNSDEVVKFEYGNPYSVMGNGMNISESGDFTIIGKVSSKLSSSENFGYTWEYSGRGCCTWLRSKSDLDDRPFRLDENDGAETNNTFRIFRHDYGHVPAPLLEGFTFVVDIPAVSQNIITQNSPGKNTFEVRFDGTGSGASAVFNLEEKELSILRGGYGYALEPQALILDDQNNTILPIDPSWLSSKHG